MKRKTYNNVMKAIKLIEKKGYSFEESKDLALRVFDEHENDVNTIEWYIDLILPKDEWLREYGKR